MQLLYCGSGWLPIVDAIRARLPSGSTIAVWDRVRPLVEAIADIDVALPSNSPFDAEVIAAAPRLRLIQQPAAGIENIARAAAVARGIPICNAPGTNHVAVAEHALFLLLALARRLPLMHRAFEERRIGVPIGIELAGKTLGIVGMGKSGRALADRARALGMKVVGLVRAADESIRAADSTIRSSDTSIRSSDDAVRAADESIRASDDAVRAADIAVTSDRAAFFAACDAFSIHCPLNDSTRGLFDSNAFAAMRPTALLVNCARGPIIDRDALVAALPKLGGVALDVHWNEPADPRDPLYADPKVLALPHVAGSTEEAFARITDVVIANLDRLARGESLLHRVA